MPLRSQIFAGLLALALSLGVPTAVACLFGYGHSAQPAFVKHPPLPAEFKNVAEIP